MRQVECTVVINNDSKVESVTVSNGGEGYGLYTLDITGGGIPGTTDPVFDVIIPPLVDTDMTFIVNWLCQRSCLF